MAKICFGKFKLQQTYCFVRKYLNFAPKYSFRYVIQFILFSFLPPLFFLSFRAKKFLHHV